MLFVQGIDEGTGELGNKRTRIKLKKCEKKDKYIDLAWESKKLRNMQVTIIPIVIGVFATILKGQEDLELGRRVETIQMTALLKTTRILRRVLET